MTKETAIGLATVISTQNALGAALLGEIVSHWPGGVSATKTVTYNSSGTFVKANYPNAVAFFVELWNGGGAGGSTQTSSNYNSYSTGSGGGGGNYASHMIDYATMPDSIPVVVGAGGSPATSWNQANPIASGSGGVSYLGTFDGYNYGTWNAQRPNIDVVPSGVNLNMGGGGGGCADYWSYSSGMSTRGGGGGGWGRQQYGVRSPDYENGGTGGIGIEAGSGGEPSQSISKNSFYGGGGGGSNQSFDGVVNKGGSSVYGGGAGSAGSAVAGGASTYGGAGGTGGVQNLPGGAGSVPGGGGGGAGQSTAGSTTVKLGGPGGAGQVKITVIYA